MFVTFKRLLHNRTYMLNTVSGSFYVFGYIPYWTYTPKYLETQYHQSAATARYGGREWLHLPSPPQPHVN